MKRYSVKPRSQIFVDAYGFLSFAKNTNKNTAKIMSKNSNGDNIQKISDHAINSATDSLKTASKKAIPKTAGTTGDFIGNKIVDKIKNVLRSSPHNSLGTVANEKENTRFDRKIPKERCISWEKRQNYWWSNININIIKKLYQKK